jgi:hypothetical protein
MLLMSIRSPLQIVKWNILLWAAIVVMALLILVTSFDHELGQGYRGFAVMLLIVFPGLYLVWNCRGDYEKYFTLFAWALIISGVVFFVWGLFYPNNFTGAHRFLGIGNNTNATGRVGPMIVMGALYLLVKQTGNKQWLFVIPALIGTAIPIMSSSRTCLLVVVLQWILFLILFLKNGIASGTFSAKRVLLIFAIVAVCLIVGLQSLLAIDRQHAGANIAERLNPSRYTSLDAMSSGRVQIFEWYFDQLNLLGNDVQFQMSAPGAGKNGAHNAVLQMAFSCGVVAGAMYVLIDLVALIFVLRHIFGKKQMSPSAFFVALSTIAFLITSTFDHQALPTSGINLLFFLSLAPVMADYFGRSRKGETG